MPAFWKSTGLVCAAAMSGGLLAGSFPPLDGSLLAWLALVPALVALTRAPDWQAGLLGYLMGAVFASLYLSWIQVIPDFPVRAHLLLIVYIAAYYGLFGFTLRLLSRRTGAPFVLIAPALWTSLEFVRVNAGFLAVPGGLLGHTQYENVSLIQIASFTSAYGISFLVVLVNAAVADAILWVWRKTATEECPRSATIATIALVVPTLVGLAHLWGDQQIKARDVSSEALLKIAAVQANIPQQIKWDRRYRKGIIDRYRQLTRTAAQDSPDLIVWPESALPVRLRVSASNTPPLMALSKETGVPLLIGSATSSKFAAGDKFHTEIKNSAFMISGGGALVGKYDKVRLLPFAEYVPFEARIPWPAWLVRGGEPFVPGESFELFALSGQPFGVVICWEALFPEPFREFVRRGARFMLNLSNEAWFDGTQASRQFLAITVFRAVEHRIWLLRAANTGISAAIDPLGVIRARVMDDSGRDLGVSGVLGVTIAAGPAGTFYTRHGDVFAIACVIITLLLMIMATVSGRTRIGRRYSRLIGQIGGFHASRGRIIQNELNTLDHK